MHSVSLKMMMALLAMTGCAASAAQAQEMAWENMTGKVASEPPAASVHAFAYGESPQVHFPPRMSVRPRRTEPVGKTEPVESAEAAYCVRTCDGRYFPAPALDNKSRAEGCRNLCPSSETRLFIGGSIDSASSKDGKPYSALANAFRYRKELVAGCTCNGKDTAGLASIKIEDDKTLRRGDLVAASDGLQVVQSVSDREARLTAASPSEQKALMRPPTVASR
jgi:hypothetical protein